MQADHELPQIVDTAYTSIVGRRPDFRDAIEAIRAQRRPPSSDENTGLRAFFCGWFAGTLEGAESAGLDDDHGLRRMVRAPRAALDGRAQPPAKWAALREPTDDKTGP